MLKKYLRVCWLLLLPLLLHSCNTDDLGAIQLFSGMQALVEIAPAQLSPAAAIPEDSLLVVSTSTVINAAPALLADLAIVNTGDITSIVPEEFLLLAATGENYGKLRSIRFFLGSDAGQERLLASLDTIPPQASSPLELNTVEQDFREMLLTDEARLVLRAEIILREDPSTSATEMPLTEDLNYVLEGIFLLSGDK